MFPNLKCYTTSKITFTPLLMKPNSSSPATALLPLTWLRPLWPHLSAKGAFGCSPLLLESGTSSRSLSSCLNSPPCCVLAQIDPSTCTHTHTFSSLSLPSHRPLCPSPSALRLSFRCLFPNFPSGDLITPPTPSPFYLAPTESPPSFHPPILQNLGNKQPWRTANSF